MSTPSTQPDDPTPRDAPYWAELAERLAVSEVPAGAINLNVTGHRLAGPVQGFGPLWRKVYRLRLAGVEVTPAEVVRVWKARFPEFQPPQNRFYPALAGVKPGEIVLLNASMRGLPVNSGVVVLYADDESFTFMTPEGCPEAGWITCSAYYESDEGSATVAEVQTIGRANDPIFEFGFRFLGGAKEQEKIWTHVLRSLAAALGGSGEVVLQRTCLDPRFQWSRAGNVWRNATIWSVLYAMTAPVRWLARPFRRSKATA
jgi:hypothetical protein